MLPVGLAGPLLLSLLAPPPAPPRLPAAPLPFTHQRHRALAAPKAPLGRGGPRQGRAAPRVHWRMSAGSVCRDMAPRDLDAVEALDRESYGGGLWSRKMYEDELALGRARVLVVESAEGGLAGVAALSHVLDEGSIENIAVLPDARGQGLGSALLCGLLAHASSLGLASLSLEVRAESNKAAVALYTRFGFKPAGRRNKYYNDGEDALILSRGAVAPTELATWLGAARARGHRLQL